MHFVDLNKFLSVCKCGPYDFCNEKIIYGITESIHKNRIYCRMLNFTFLINFEWIKSRSVN